MDMRQIMYVIELSKNGSLNQTAQKMFLSKPNLSYAIKSLESELGFDIFDRTTSGMRLTNSGKQFVDYARPVYQQFQYLQNVCSNMASANSPVLSVSTVSLKFVGNIFTEIYKGNLGENVVFKYYEDTNSNVVDNVANSISDIGIVIFTSPQLKTWKRLIKVRHLTYHKITTEPPFVILGKHNPLFYRDTESVTLDEMLPFPYISSPPEILSIDDDRLEISRHLMHQQKKTHLTVSNRGMLYDLLENTTAYSISSNNRNAYSKKPAYEKIRAIPLKDSGFEFEIGWICRENFILSPICAEFVNKIIATLTGGDSNAEKSVLPQGLSH